MNQQSSLHGVTLQRPNRGHALNRHWELQTCFCRAAVLVRSCWIWRVSPRSLSHASSSRPGFAIDKFHILQHANAAVDEVRRAEFFRQGVKKRGLIKGKRWLLLSRWKNLAIQHRGELNRLFKLNRCVFKAYLLKESLERLWDYRYEGAMLNYLQNWMDQLKWQRLRPFEKLADMLVNHLEGILNYCRMKVPMGVVEAVNGNIKSLLRRGRGYTNLRYLLLKAQRMAVTKTEFVVFRKAA